MEKITKLIQSLSSREIRLFRKYAALSGKKKNNLKIRLFNISCENPEISDKEAIELLELKPGAAFSMLKSRLFNDLLDFLIVITSERNFYAKAFWTRYSILKSLMLVHALNNRNVVYLADQQIYKAEQLAKRFDQPSYYVLVNEVILNTRPFLKGPSTTKKVTESMNQSLTSQSDIINIQNVFKQLASTTNYNANQTKSQLQFIESKLQEIEEIYNRNPSPRISFYYLRSKISYSNLTQNFRDLNRYAQEFLTLVTTEVSVKSSDNLGGAYQLVAQSLIQLNRYQEAIEACKASHNYFFKYSNNQINSDATLFVGYLKLKDYAACDELVKSIRNIKRIKRGSFNYSKWLYLDANIKFIQGDYKATLQLLDRHSFLKTDRTGWRLGYKILEMMCIVEMGNYDWLPYRIDAFRKLVSDIKKENTARPKLILKLLKRLIKENFDFDATTKKMSEEYALLQSNTGDYFCDMLGYEVIRFDEWWAGKLKPTTEETTTPKRKRKNVLKD